jgi:hypothetical protein
VSVSNFDNNGYDLAYLVTLINPVNTNQVVCSGPNWPLPGYGYFTTNGTTAASYLNKGATFGFISSTQFYISISPGGGTNTLLGISFSQ